MAGIPQNLLLEHAGIDSIRDLAALPAVRECAEWFSAQKRWIDEKHLEICRIPAPTFQEEARAAWMVSEFQQLGYHASLDRAGNVIASANKPAAGPLVAVTAHLDTVLSPRRPEDVRIAANGRLEGPGVSDNGVGLTALLAIAASLKDSLLLNLHGPQLLFLANVGEEGEGNLSGMRFLCRQSGLGSQIHSFLVIDGPSTEHITSRAIASRRFEVTFSGTGGHSWSDFGIGNPVHALGRAISLFSDQRYSQPGNGGPRSTFNFGLIDGGTSVNAIPVSAAAKVDLRSEDPIEIEQMTSEVTAAVERALEMENSRCNGSPLTAKIREIGFRPGGMLPDDALILQYLRAVDAHLGIRSQLDSASTDANIPLSLGWEAVSIGAGGQGGGAHTPDEWFDPEGREIGLTRLLFTLCLLLRTVSRTEPVAGS